MIINKFAFPATSILRQFTLPSYHHLFLLWFRLSDFRGRQKNCLLEGAGK